LSANSSKELQNEIFQEQTFHFGRNVKKYFVKVF
jgi:hypothetical protein